MVDRDYPVEYYKKDPLNLVFAGLVLVVSFIVYFLTVQRTLSFWDCGEFITCAYVLGIPHPPGTPLFVLLGNVVSNFPIGEDPSFRINLISCVSSAFAAMLGYLTATWLIRRWYADQEITFWKRVTIYLGGLVGGFYFAFGRTNWNNSVEAEVYGTSMLFMMATIYLTLLWIDYRKTARGESFLIAMAYLATLALGVHMTSYIVMPMAFLLIILVDEDYRRSWQIWVTYIILMLVIYQVVPFIISAVSWVTIACMATYWERIKTGWVYTLVLPAIAVFFFLAKGAPFVPVYGLSLFLWSLLTLAVMRLDAGQKFWRTAFLITLAALMGYSVQIFIPIRAAQKPQMNMNIPDNWDSFRSFLERKQYGSENMITRMFERRGEWKNQFGNHPRMGFWGFFSEQYGINGKRFLILFFMGLYGIYYAIRFHWKSGIFMFLLILAGTVGLVLYMNFADGTRENKMVGEGHLEVRDRDYFWTPGFVLFGIAIGLGVAAFFDIVRSLLSSPKVPGIARSVVLGILCLAVLLPYSAIAKNYFVNDRSRNFIPYDYAWNILQSASEGAVMFTNGDNDTFPVWCLQYVYGIRPDVKIANLSLINTSWYIKQLKHKLEVPISYTDEQIEGLRHMRTPDGNIYRVQDQMIENIVNTNKWEQPIEFAVTVAQKNKVYRGKPLDPYMQMHGMALRLFPNKQPDAVDLEATKRLYWEVFKYRGVTDTTVYKDENASRLVNNYLSGFLIMADTLQRAGKVDEAASHLYKAIELIGGGVEPWAYLCRMYVLAGRFEDAERVLDEAPPDIPTDRLRMYLATAYADKGEVEKAKSNYEMVWEESPDSREVFTEIFRFYYENQMQAELAKLLADWAERHPEDQQVVEAYEQLKREAPQLFQEGETLPDTEKVPAVTIPDTGAEN